ncbi:MAG: response regulator [Candidatus Absconditabacterales bacterium]
MLFLDNIEKKIKDESVIDEINLTGEGRKKMLEDIVIDILKDIDENKTKEKLNEIFEGKNFLVIDNDYSGCYLLETHLKQVRGNVDVSYDFKDAMKKLQNKKYDFILGEFDLNHAKLLGGAEFLKNIKENSKFKNILTIAITSDAMIGEEKIYEDFGCDAYITKPIQRKKLLEDIIKLHVIKNKNFMLLKIQ